MQNQLFIQKVHYYYWNQVLMLSIVFFSLCERSVSFRSGKVCDMNK